MLAAPIDVIGEPAWNTGFEKEITRDLRDPAATSTRNSSAADGVRADPRAGSTPGTLPAARAAAAWPA